MLCNAVVIMYYVFSSCLVTFVSAVDIVITTDGAYES